jgi:hypothetical protein
MLPDPWGKMALAITAATLEPLQPLGRRGPLWCLFTHLWLMAP